MTTQFLPALDLYVPVPTTFLPPAMAVAMPVDTTSQPRAAMAVAIPAIITNQPRAAMAVAIPIITTTQPSAPPLIRLPTTREAVTTSTPTHIPAPMTSFAAPSIPEPAPALHTILTPGHLNWAGRALNSTSRTTEPRTAMMR